VSNPDADHIGGYGTARVLLAGDAEAKEEEYMASAPCTGSLTVHQRLETTHTLLQGSAPCWLREPSDVQFVLS
jgi:hypothetical protein